MGCSVATYGFNMAQRYRNVAVNDTLKQDPLNLALGGLHSNECDLDHMGS